MPVRGFAGLAGLLVAGVFATACATLPDRSADPEVGAALNQAADRLRAERTAAFTLSLSETMPDTEFDGRVDFAADRALVSIWVVPAGAGDTPSGAGPGQRRLDSQLLFDGEEVFEGRVRADPGSVSWRVVQQRHDREQPPGFTHEPRAVLDLLREHGQWLVHRSQGPDGTTVYRSSEGRPTFFREAVVDARGRLRELTYVTGVGSGSPATLRFEDLGVAPGVGPVPRDG